MPGLSTYGALHGNADIVSGERLGDPGSNTRPLGEKAVRLTVEQENDRHAFAFGHRSLLVQVASDCHAPHTAHL